MIGILLVAVIFTWVVLDIASGIKLRRAIAAWQDAGLPMDVQEVVPPGISADENAAVVINHVIPIRDPIKLKDRRALELEKQAIELGNEIFADLSAGNRPTNLLEELKTILSDPTLSYKLEMARQAVGYEHYNAYLDYELGFDLLVPHVGPFRNLSKVLMAEAAVAVSEGEWAEVYESVITSFRLAELIAEEPLVISVLTHRAIQKKTLEKLEILLRMQSPDDVAARRLDQILAESNDSHMSRATLMEGVMSIDYLYRQLENGTFAPSRLMDTHGVSYRWLDSWIFRPWHKADIASYINVIRERITMLLKSGDGMDSYRLMKEWEEEAPTRFPWYARSAKALTPSIVSRVYLHEVEMIARLALAQAALAASAYREDHGALPEKLMDLVPEHLPEIPQDPFDKEPLRYSRTADRVVLYSIGPNVKDDGGLAVERPSTNEPGDIVWVLEEADGG